MSESAIVSGPDLIHIGDDDIVVPSSSSNSTTHRSGSGTSGGSTYLTCGILVDDPGDSDYAWAGSDSTWAIFTRSPGASPLRIGLQFGALSFRARGWRNNELGFSTHEVYSSLNAFARVLHPDVRDLRPSGSDGLLLSFWNVSVGPQNEAKLLRRTSAGSQTFDVNQNRWDRTLVAFPPMLEFTYNATEEIAERDWVVFLVGFRLTISAPSVNDFDFQLDTESSASIAWVSVESGSA